MLFRSLLTTSLLAVTASTAPAGECTADFRRKGLRYLIQAFIHGVDDASFKQTPPADNVTSIILLLLYAILRAMLIHFEKFIK
ncbi:uncharacterized protein CLAFUR5_00152 [Fulvia fulva]|uniref:Uncharacterized protein n=1 Tax=Passalora fulva TaxID=5499 RepID=A0A9Q8L824_PASFU|nr:uncharacterized protein CLAFUR5_00152 [Fulvia fulva]KAK4637513.1 hypothetical protein CLAFUR0_00152 [Fulvia fulva]UJO12520.1 hypothetical protein CLAFUR5_00152 [Fulvia fulva]WPV24081.1 hypothetical protein CLAFUW7_00154 [Fulvia fulva]